MPYDLADLKKIKVHIKRDLPTMASTSEVDYSFSNIEKLPIHNQDTKEGSVSVAVDESPSSEIRAASIEVLRDIQNPSPGSSKMENSKDKSSLDVNKAIDKIEKILEGLKKQKSLEYRRVVRHASKKRFRNKNTKPLTSTDISSDDSDSSRSPSLKRMKKDTTQSTRMKYDSDSSDGKKNYKYRGRSSSSSSDRSLSCVSKHLKKELSNFLGDSFISINSSKRRSRKTKRDRSRNAENDSNERSKRPRYDSRDRSKYSRTRRNYSRDNSRSEDHSYDPYSRRRSGRQERYQNYDRNYQLKPKDIEERYSRYYAVMYAFSIIMDILRQDDIYSTF